MEVVGGVASIVTLIEASGILARVSKDLVLRWRNAPHEIQALATRLSLFAAELQSIKNVTARSHPVLTDAIIRQSLSDLLTDVRKRLTKLESLHFRLEQHGPLRQKFQWTAKDAGPAEKMLNKTQEIEQRLANLMTLISLRAQTPILDGLDRIEQMVSTLVVALPASAPSAPATPPSIAANATGNTPSHTGYAISSNRAHLISLWRSGKSLGSWGFRGALVTTKSGYHTNYNVNFSVPLPLARILGTYALTGCLSLRSTPLCRSFFTFRHPSYFAVARVVDKHHPFMLACRRGDIVGVRSMLRSGEGRPTDLTVEGETPMLFASHAGSVEVVAELLECGVEVDGIVELEARSTMLEVSSIEKHLDLVRFLLHHGASADHISTLGHAAGSLCWGTSDLTTKHSSLDIYNVLSESTDIDMHHDKDHLAAAVCFAAFDGCGSQINSLIGFGYDIYRYAFQPRDTLDLAAKAGNYSTYSALVSHFGIDIFANDADIFTWLLKGAMLGKSLCMAQDSDWTGEHEKVLRDILRRCGDQRLLPLPPYCETYPILPTLLCKEMTAVELAAALGPETEAWYLGMVRSCGFLNEDEENEVMQRLRKLSLAEHVTSGFVYEGEEESGEPEGLREFGSEDCDEDSALAEEDRMEHADIDVNHACQISNESETDEADQFWEASEGI